MEYIKKITVADDLMVLTRQDDTNLTVNNYTTAEKQKLAGLSNYDDSSIKQSITDLQNNKADKSELDSKVDKIEGKSLSTNDFTNEEKTKLAGLSNYDDTNVAKLKESNSFTKKQRIYSNEIFGVTSGDQLPYIEFGEEAIIDSSTVPAVNVFSYNSTSAKTQKFQDKDGVIALTSDIPTAYVKDASVTNDVLTIEKQDGTTVQFEGGGGGSNIIWRKW